MAYAWHIAHTHPTILLLLSTFRPHITAPPKSKDNKWWHLFTKDIVIYVPVTNVPIKFHPYNTCSNYLICNHKWKYVNIIPHRSLLPWTIWAEKLHKMTMILMTIMQPNCTHTSCIWSFCHISQKSWNNKMINTNVMPCQPHCNVISLKCNNDNVVGLPLFTVCIYSCVYQAWILN